eukprot:gb/GECG01014480.1/.p1 GENE.gb/GECG01014480.1/~~gb/GECG01014480.1/.p1  ORF type:complete len:601 (+),score=110.37 gb/GECG01014480.1/:1-1803(+)
MSLSEEQAERLRQAQSSTQEILAAGVTKLLLYQPQHGSDISPKRLSDDANANEGANGWLDTGIWGAVLFTYDQSCDQHLFRLFDLEHYELRFEYEVYEDLQLDQLSDELLGFETDDFYVAFLFADEGDAADMLSTVEEEAPRAADALQLIALNQHQPAEQGSTHGREDGADHLQDKRLKRLEKFFGVPPNTLGGTSPLFPEQRRLQDALKEMSILSTDFHIALTDDGTLNISSIPTPLKQFFKQVGIRKRDLRKPQSAKMIISALREANVIMDFDVRDSTPNAQAGEESSTATIDGSYKEPPSGASESTPLEVSTSSTNAASSSSQNYESQTSKFSPHPPAQRKESVSPSAGGTGTQSAVHTSGPPHTSTSPQSHRSASQRKRQGRSSILFSQQKGMFEGDNGNPNDASDDSQAQPVSQRLMRRASATRGLKSYPSEGSEESSASKTGKNKRRQNGLKGALQAAILTGSRRKKPDEQSSQPQQEIKEAEQPTGPDFLKEIKKGGNSGGFALKRVNKKQNVAASTQKDSQSAPSSGEEETKTASSADSTKKRKGRVSVVNFSNEGQALTVMEKLRATMNARRQHLEPDEDESSDSASDWSD